jgi:hypothetical protein
MREDALADQLTIWQPYLETTAGAEDPHPFPQRALSVVPRDVLENMASVNHVKGAVTEWKFRAIPDDVIDIFAEDDIDGFKSGRAPVTGAYFERTT